MKLCVAWADKAGLPQPLLCRLSVWDSLPCLQERGTPSPFTQCGVAVHGQRGSAWLLPGDQLALGPTGHQCL